MARPLRIEYPGAFYHVTSRGNEKKDIFKTVADREKFLFYLASACARYGAEIHAYGKEAWGQTYTFDIIAISLENASWISV